MTGYHTSTLIILILSINASPLQSKWTHLITKRQAIPDRNGNTGSRPSSVAPSSPRPVSSSTSAAFSTIAPSSTSTDSSTFTITSPTTTPSSSSVTTPTIPTTSTVSTPEPTPSPSPWIQTYNTKQSLLIAPPAIAGIILGSIILLALITSSLLLLYQRRKARHIREIIARRTPIAKPAVAHYNSKIAPSRNCQCKPVEMSGSSVSSWGSTGKNKLVATYVAPLSPSVYSRATAGSGDEWQDVYAQMVVTGTPSALLNVPRPLFLNRENMHVGDDTRSMKWL